MPSSSSTQGEAAPLGVDLGEVGVTAPVARFDDLEDAEAP